MLRITFGAMALVLVALVAFVFLAFPAERGPNRQLAPVSVVEDDVTLASMKPPKRTRPVIAIIGDNDGSETTDYLIPYGVLKRSGVADVFALGVRPGPVKLMPTLTIIPDATIDVFDQRYPEGADYVIVPAMHVRNAPAMVSWLKRQAKSGATIVGVCAGGVILAEAGLLHERRATTHWFWIDTIRSADSTIRYVPDRRYVADRGVVTTTGISASVPVSLALVAAIAGRVRADELAGELGVRDWGTQHDSQTFRLTRADIGAYAANFLMLWRHEQVGVPIAAGVDEIALALTADAFATTHRASALALASGAEPITTKSGLRVVPGGVLGSMGVDVTQNVLSEDKAALALDLALEVIGSRYGAGSVAIVQLELEYPVGR